MRLVSFVAVLYITTTTNDSFCGLTRSQKPGAVTTLASESPNWMFTYDRRQGSWTQILPQLPHASPRDTSDHLQPERELIEEPLPRYAHQVVYNTNTKTVFMHGGNGGNVGPMERSKDVGKGDEVHKERRLDDLWQMKLVRLVQDPAVPNSLPTCLTKSQGRFR